MQTLIGGNAEKDKIILKTRMIVSVGPLARGSILTKSSDDIQLN